MSTNNSQIDMYHHLVSGAEKPGNISTLVQTDFSKALNVTENKIAFNNLLKMGVSQAHHTVGC